MAKKIKVQEKECSRCKITKSYRDGKEFYASSNVIINSDGYLPICKECLKELAGDFQEYEPAKDLLRSIDKPFLIEFFKKGLDSKNAFVAYMTVINGRYKKTLTWLDSEFDVTVESISTESQTKSKKNKLSTSELKLFWGDRYTNADLDRLQGLFDSYLANFESSSPAQKQIYRDIAVATLEAEKALTDNNTDEYFKWQAHASKLRNDGGLKQGKVNEDKAVDTWGVSIANIEMTDPAEYFGKKRARYVDWDGFAEYFKKIFLRPFKNTFLDQRDFEVGNVTIPTDPSLKETEVK